MKTLLATAAIIAALTFPATAGSDGVKCLKPDGTPEPCELRGGTAEHPAPVMPETTPLTPAQQEQERKQLLQYCLQEAYADYSHAWADACSRKQGGLNANGSDCKLPSLFADRLKVNLDTARNFCLQKSAVGL